MQLAPLFMFSISSGILPRPDDACIGRGLAGAAHLPPSQRPKPPLRSCGVRLHRRRAVLSAPAGSAVPPTVLLSTVRYY